MKAAAILLACLVALPARAEFMDGNSLLSKIQGDSYDRVLAMGYIEGVYDATRGITHCPTSSNITAGQLLDMVHQHLLAFPGGRHFTADLIVGYVLKRAWPCAQKGQGV